MMKRNLLFTSLLMLCLPGASARAAETVVRVTDINPGPADANPGGFVTFQDALYFAADDGEHGTELFRWNGTHAGLAADINPNPVYEEGGDRLSDSVPQQLTVLGEALYFIASDGTTRGIWRFDGTTASILGGGLLNNVSEIVLCNDEHFVFRAHTNGVELIWHDYDGAEAYRETIDLR